MQEEKLISDGSYLPLQCELALGIPTMKEKKYNSK